MHKLYSFFSPRFYVLVDGREKKKKSLQLNQLKMTLFALDAIKQGKTQGHKMVTR